MSIHRIQRRSHTRRRGSILVVVLALLALFAVVGLSFALYAESNANSARNNRAARSLDNPPDPTDTARMFLNQTMFDTNDTTSALYTWSLAQSKYGPITTNYVPFAGTGIPQEVASGVDRRKIVNFNGTGVQPYTNNAGTAFTRAVPWTYPDSNNFFLAWMNPDSPTTGATPGAINVPSFYRSDLFGTDSGTFYGLAPNNPNWTNTQGRYMTLRPRSQEHANFPKIMPDLDGQYRGDVSNMKFITGVQKNDSLWMHIGSPVLTWRGKQYTTMVAPLILDLSGRINLSIAGDRESTGNTHGSQHGFGPWEINPTKLGMSASDLQALIRSRQGNTLTVPIDPNRGSRFSTINLGRFDTNTNAYRLPHRYGSLNVNNNVATAAPFAITLPTAGGSLPFPTYPTSFDSTAGNWSTSLNNHPSCFNPFLYARGGTTSGTTPHGFGMDQLIHLLGRYSDPKNPPRYNADQMYTQATTSMGNTGLRHRTTPFSVSQQWGNLKIRTGAAATNVYTLGPIDLNRPLASYRPDPTQPYPQANATIPANYNMHQPGTPNYNSAVQSRQNLARDIFVRLVAAASDPIAGTGLIDGTNVKYNPTSGYLEFTGAPSAGIRQCAQLAANIVDYIDDDDIITQFVYNPLPATLDTTTSPPTYELILNPNTTYQQNFDAAQLPNRVVYGTELPRLVINEAYSNIVNDAQDLPMPQLQMMKRPAQFHMIKKFWIELHNPMQNDNGTFPDAGAARIKDTTDAYSIYELQIADYAAAGAYSTYLQTNEANAAIDPSTGGAGINVKIKTTNWKQSAGAPNTIAPAADLKIVKPANGASSGSYASNEGYFLVGPQAIMTDTANNPQISHPDQNQRAANSLTMALPGGVNVMMGVPAGPGIDQMAYVAGSPTDANINTERNKLHIAILRRLVNPYLAPQTDPVKANYNPYVTVDYIEGIQSRDRVKFNDQDERQGFMPDTSASQGRSHPYSSTSLGNQQYYDYTTPPGMALTPAPDPNHSFFQKNSNLSITPASWLTHLDRELINSTEVMNTSIYSPGLLTNKYRSGANFNMHTRVTPTPSNRGAFDDAIFPTGAVYPATSPVQNLSKVFDLLTVSSRLPQVPLGGRSPGQVNINGAYDSTTLSALFDQNSGNNFTAADVSNASLVIQKRTPGTTPTGTTDNPLSPSTVTMMDLLYVTTAAHPYMAQEPLRKILNNVSTTGDAFLVIYTVGFFEVDSTAPLTFGKEMYDKVPGDLRAQFAAVVDRSMLGITQTNTVFSSTTGAVQQPWETKMTTDAAVGSTTLSVQGTSTGIIQPDGSTVSFANIYSPAAPLTNYVRVGLGDSLNNSADGEWVRVSNAVYAGSGKVTLTVAATTRYHAAGTRVGAILPGNPGPQPSIDVTDNTKYRHLVPYFTRLWN